MYRLYYWPHIQGRGEFIRLALEAGGADYVDVGRLPEAEGGGRAAIARMLEGGGRVPFAPPILEDGETVLFQTTHILGYLGPRLGLVPDDEAGRNWVQQLLLVVADLVVEAHDTHHPIAKSLYYEAQKPESLRRAADFRELRLPRFLGYFERVLAGADTPFVGGERLTTADLSLFQVVEGLRYAFPMTMARLAPGHPRVCAVREAVAAHSRITAYLASPRRIPFNDKGIFRRYPELDG